MVRHVEESGELATAITKAGSKQTFYTIKLFADRKYALDAFRAYGYFRWLDAESGSKADKLSFANRQQSLLAACYRGENPPDLCAEEQILVDLVRHDRTENSGLRTYLHSMMEVMIFDARRRGQLITQAELPDYSDNRAKGATHGLCHNLTQLGYFRPDMQHRRYRNLYFAGASIRPGTGMPTAMISGRLCAQRIIDHIS